MAAITAMKHFKNQPSYGYYALANAANQTAQSHLSIASTIF